MRTINDVTEGKQKWYKNGEFPLIPIFEIKKGNEYNTNGFSFAWLFLKIWTLDGFDFELSFGISTHWGIGITALVPYLRIILCIPCPMFLEILVQKYLWRHPKAKATE